jgi:FRG domain
MPLKKLVVRDASYVTDPTTGEGFFHVSDPHALIQAAGYLKYKNAGNSELIYFRGHTRTYSGLQPTLFRGCHTHAAQSSRESYLAKSIDEIRTLNRIFRLFYKDCHEPLLQHYGLKTSWIDLVDNIWVALWFGCHKARVAGDVNEYMHYERRIPSLASDEYAYISLIAADVAQTEKDRPGLYLGTNTELVDLRVACPSIFLRPHSQHALLFRNKGGPDQRPTDYSSQIRGVIRAKLSDALAWLGEGMTLSTHSLFPPAFYDRGYNMLLSSAFKGTKTVGSIINVGA